MGVSPAEYSALDSEQMSSCAADDVERPVTTRETGQGVTQLANRSLGLLRTHDVVAPVQRETPHLRQTDLCDWYI
jgi:hypothetical protein